MAKVEGFIQVKLTFILSVLIAGGLAACSSKEFGDAFVEKQLATVSNEQNKKLPIMVDKDTRWDSTVAGPGRNWVYLYTLVSPEAKSVTDKQIKDILGDKIRNGVCTMKDMEYFVKNRVTMKYSYQDIDGRSLGEVVVTPEDCSKAVKPK